MFEGIFSASMDGTGRITLPLGFRDAFVKTLMDNRVIITNAQPLGPIDEMIRGIKIFPYQKWTVVENKITNSFPENEELQQALYRRIIVPANQRFIDKRGRIRIPLYFRPNVFNLNKQDVILVGMKNSISIWPKNSWAKVEDVVKDRMSRLVEW